MTCGMCEAVRTIGRIKMAGLAVVALALAGSVASAGPNPFRNIRNTPFQAVSNGPQGAIVVEDGGSMDRVSVARAVQDATAEQHSVQHLSQLETLVRFLKDNGLIERDSDARVPRLILHTRNGAPVLGDLVSVADTGAAIGDGNNEIKFEYEGWSTGDQSSLEAYLNEAVPIARAVYGPPAFDITVKIIRDENLQNLQGGTYDVSTNEIRIPPMSGNFPEDTLVLLMLVLQAFRDDVALFYDSWEQGMSRAAATIVQAKPGVSPGYDPAAGPYSVSSVYEWNNRPGLGNSTWFPASGFSGMLAYRIAMARSVWLKCYVEDPEFFQRFNTQYYNLLNSLTPAEQATIPGDTPTLLEICKTVLPQVEGESCFAWIRHQYALDTSVAVGLKLYTWVIPLENYVPLIVNHYDTGATGDEMPRGGTAQTKYFNYDFTRTLFAQEGNEIQIVATGSSAGEGFLIPSFFNVGGEQLITIQMELNGLFARYPYPYGVRIIDFDTGENTFDLYGAIVGPTSGTVDVVGLEGLDDESVERGVWGGVVNNKVLSPAKLEITFEDGHGNVVTRRVNVAWDAYGVMLEADTRSVVAKSLPRGVNGLYLMSLPVTPVHTDAALAMGIPADDLLLARWRPNAPGGGAYDIYPTIDSFRPGRGFWLKVLEDVTIAVDGLLPSDSDDVRVQLYAGWNQLGTGRNRTVDTDELLLQRGGGGSQTLDEAVADGWVQAGVWGYSQVAGYSLSPDMEIFDAYWMRCLLPEGVLVIFPAFSTSAGTASAGQGTGVAASPLGDTTWEASLVLDCEGLSGEAMLGTASAAKRGYDALYDLQSPPAFEERPTLQFTHGDWGADSGEYVTDIRGESTKGPWSLRATGLPEGSRARVSWPDLSAVPADLRPVLLDKDTGREVHMRTTTSYEFAAGGGEREFEVKLRRGAAGALAVVGLTGMQTRQGASITYTLSADASVTGRVLNLAGRPVRDVIRDRSQSAGLQSLVWDLKSSAGLMVPNGRYLVELTARAADGQQFSSMGSILVAR